MRRVAMAVPAATMLVGGLALAGGGGLRYVHHLEIAEPGTSIARANCPSGTEVVGGGGGIAGTSEDFELNATTPASSGDGWLAVVINQTGADVNSHVHAICTRSSAGIVTVERSEPVAAGSIGTRSARCPQGTDVLGGGVDPAQQSSSIEVSGTLPFDGDDRNPRRDDGWHAQVNNESTAMINMSVTAICTENGRGLSYLSSGRTIRANQSETLRLGCPANTKPTGGGVDLTGINPGYEVSDSLPADDRDRNPRADDAWVGSANNDDKDGRRTTLKVFAICKG